LMLGRITDTAFLHIILGVVEHLGPVILLIDDLMGEKAASQMIPTVAIMDFLYHSLSSIWSEAPQVGVDMKLGVRLLV